MTVCTLISSTNVVYIWGQIGYTHATVGVHLLYVLSERYPLAEGASLYLTFFFFQVPYVALFNSIGMVKRNKYCTRRYLGNIILQLYVEEPRSQHASLQWSIDAMVDTMVDAMVDAMVD